jgi:hypothetical protein
MKHVEDASFKHLNINLKYDFIDLVTGVPSQSVEQIQ